MPDAQTFFALAVILMVIALNVVARFLPDHSAPGRCSCGETIGLDETECAECFSVRLSAP